MNKQEQLFQEFRAYRTKTDEEKNAFWEQNAEDAQNRNLEEKAQWQEAITSNLADMKDLLSNIKQKLEQKTALQPA